MITAMPTWCNPLGACVARYPRFKSKDEAVESTESHVTLNVWRAQIFMSDVSEKMSRDTDFILNNDIIRGEPEAKQIL